jgi:hypothetical protein
MGGHHFKLLIAVAALAILHAPASATDFSVADQDYEMANGWAITVTPYAWAPSFVGDFTIRGYNVNASASFFDLIRDADRVVPAMGYVELQKDRFAVFGDVFYAQLGFARSDTVHFDPLAELKITLSAKAKLLTTLAIAQAGAAYEVARWEEGEGAWSALDLYAGARYWYASADLTVDFKESIDFERRGWKRVGKQSINLSGRFDWVDAVVGMRVRQQLSPGNEIEFVGDIGGFGAGSNVSWQVYGGYTRSFRCGNASVAASFGYRVLGVDYDGGSGKNVWHLDTIMHGPLAALSVHW